MKWSLFLRQLWCRISGSNLIKIWSTNGVSTWVSSRVTNTSNSCRGWKYHWNLHGSSTFRARWMFGRVRWSSTPSNANSPLWSQLPEVQMNYKRLFDSIYNCSTSPLLLCRSRRKRHRLRSFKLRNRLSRLVASNKSVKSILLKKNQLSILQPSPKVTLNKARF